MKVDFALYFIGGGLISFFAVVIFNKKQLKIINNELLNEINKNRQLEKDVHLHETRFLAEKNKLEIENYQYLKETKQKSFDDGYEKGKEDSFKDFLIKKGELEVDYKEKNRQIELDSFERGKKQAQSDFELLSNTFTVSISPYVNIKTDKGIFSDTHLSEIGYKYQLLVKGIPAFQPHICVEQREEVKEINEERINRLSDLAIKVTEMAVGSYLSNMPSSIFKIGTTVIDNNTSD
jgi:hypothetical protein